MFWRTREFLCRPPARGGRARLAAEDVTPAGAGATFDYGRGVSGLRHLMTMSNTWASYRLTTVRQPVGRMTGAAAAMLMERIADPELPREVRTFAGKLEPGGSARIG